MFLKNSVYLIILAIACLLISGSCEKAPNYSDVPAISFNSLRVVAYPANNNTNPATPLQDSVFITINFQDGNGDIGNNPAQSNDYFVNAYKKVNGQFVIFSYDTSTNTITFDGNLPLLSPYNVTGPIKGTITQNLSIPYLPINSIGLQRFDTLMFQVQIKDRANNYSNWVETTPMILWQDSIF
jgi:hypothetical protein